MKHNKTFQILSTEELDHFVPPPFPHSTEHGVDGGVYIIIWSYYNLLFLYQWIVSDVGL